MYNNQSYPKGRTLTYAEFVSNKKKSWQLEKKDTRLGGYYGFHQLQENYFI